MVCAKEIFDFEERNQSWDPGQGGEVHTLNRETLELSCASVVLLHSAFGRSSTKASMTFTDIFKGERPWLQRTLLHLATARLRDADCGLTYVQVGMLKRVVSSRSALRWENG
jgi:hypothetical protein